MLLAEITPTTTQASTRVQLVKHLVTVRTLVCGEMTSISEVLVADASGTATLELNGSLVDQGFHEGDMLLIDHLSARIVFGFLRLESLPQAIRVDVNNAPIVAGPILCTEYQEINTK